MRDRTSNFLCYWCYIVKYAEDIRSVELLWTWSKFVWHLAFDFLRSITLASTSWNYFFFFILELPLSGACTLLTVLPFLLITSAGNALQC